MWTLSKCSMSSCGRNVIFDSNDADGYDSNKGFLSKYKTDLLIWFVVNIIFLTAEWIFSNNNKEIKFGIASIKHWF